MVFVFFHCQAPCSFLKGLLEPKDQEETSSKILEGPTKKNWLTCLQLNCGKTANQPALSGSAIMHLGSGPTNSDDPLSKINKGAIFEIGSIRMHTFSVYAFSGPF